MYVCPTRWIWSSRLLWLELWRYLHQRRKSVRGQNFSPHQYWKLNIKELNTCCWVVGLADIGKDFTELKCDFSTEGSNMSCVSKTNWKRHLWSVCVNVGDVDTENITESLRNVTASFVCKIFSSLTNCFSSVQHNDTAVSSMLIAAFWLSIMI